MDTGKFQELVLQQLEALNEGQKALFEGQKQLENRMSNVEKSQQQLESRIGNIEKGQLRLETRMEAVEKNQLRLESRIESEVVEKIRGLYDNREVQNERFERIENKISSIEKDTGYLVAKVARLESLAK